MRSGSQRWAIALAMVVLLAVGASPAVAHSFLATTRPAQGERLADAPREVALQLSEPVEPESAKVQVTDGEGVPVEVGRLEFDSGGAVVRLPLVSPEARIYRVSWHVVSALDAHESAGEFAFAVGDDVVLSATGTGSKQATGVSPLVTAATWLLLAGWSVAFGATVLAHRSVGVRFPGRPGGWVRAGAVTALAGLAGRAGATPGDGTVTVMLVAGLALAAALAVASTRRTWPPMVALAAFAVVWPARGHAATTAVGWVLDSVHLLAAGVWVGGLTVVVFGMATAARHGRPREGMPLLRVYARTAWLAVAALVLTGVLLGWSLVPSLGSLLTDSYGRLLAIKSALLLVAVAAAVIARRKLAAPDADRLQRAIRPEHASLALAVVVAALLVDTPPRPPTVEMLLGPPPIDGPVARVAGMAGLITLDVQAGDGRLDVNARGPSGGVDADLTLTAVLPDGTELDLNPRPCGVGCSTIQLNLPPGETLLTATARADDWAGGSTSLNIRWPPAAQDPALFDRMRQAMLAADDVVVVEEVGAYPAADADGPSMSGPQLVQLMPWAGGVTDVRSVPGEPGRFTFYLPGSYMWFDVTVDGQGRLLTQRLVNPGHDIRYRFRYPSTDPAATSATPPPSPPT